MKLTDKLDTVVNKKIPKKLLQIMELAENTVLPENYKVVWSEEQLRDLSMKMALENEIAIDTETTGVLPFSDKIVGISMWFPSYEEGAYIPLVHKEHCEDGAGIIGKDFVRCPSMSSVINSIKKHLENPTKKLILHNAKFDAHILYNCMGIAIKPYFDTMIASVLLDENMPKGLKDLSGIYLEEPADKFNQLFGKITFDNVPILLDEKRRGCLAGYYAIKDAHITYRLYQFFSEALDRRGLENIKDIMFNIEMPVSEIMTRAERHGVKLDVEYLEKKVAPELYSQLGQCYKCKGFFSINDTKNGKLKKGESFYFCECQKDFTDGVVQKIWRRTGEINLRSPTKIGDALYIGLKFPIIDFKPKKPKLTKTGKLSKVSPYSTDKKTLKKLRAKLREYGESEDVGLIDAILEFRSQSKLIDAFVDKLPKAVVSGRLHPSYNTVGTVTTRMSCSKPNLQQIPSKIGNLIRNAFVADEGRLLASLDFSGQELRVLAHVSKCPVLMDIYNNDKDVHSMTGVGVYNMMNNTNYDYDYYQYCRSLQDYFLDKDGEVSFEKFNAMDELFEKGLIKSKIITELKHELKLGKDFEKVRKNYAKMLNFGIIYGSTEIGVSDTLGVSQADALQMIQSFLNTYPGVKRWIKEQHNQILKQKYTLSMCGGKRRLYPEVNTGQQWRIEKAFRMGVNSVIQRSSAEMTKLAMIKVQPLLKELDARIVLQIHDEIIYDVPEDIGIDNLKRIADIMCSALPLDCGMKSDIEVGKKWGQRLSEDDLNSLRHIFEGDSDEELFE